MWSEEVEEVRSLVERDLRRLSPSCTCTWEGWGEERGVGGGEGRGVGGGERGGEIGGRGEERREAKHRSLRVYYM